MVLPRGALTVAEFADLIESGAEKKFYLYDPVYELAVRKVGAFAYMSQDSAHYLNMQGEPHSLKFSYLRSGAVFIFLNYWHAYAHMLRNRKKDELPKG